MDTLLIAVCEDLQAERDALSAALEQSAIPSACTVFPSGEALLADYRPGSWDLILMDIFMEGMSGVEAVAQIRARDPDVPIAFLTTSPDYTMEGYRYRVDRYLLKPVRQEDLDELLNLAARNKRNQPAVTLSVQGRKVTIPYARLCYAEQEGHAAHLHLTGGETLRAVMKLTDLAALLPTPPFYQCHKSYLVNLAHVSYLDQEMKAFVMSNGGNAYIRRDSLRKAKELYSRYMFEQVRR